MFENSAMIIAAVISLSLIGAFFGLILSIANKKLHVKQDPRIEKIISVLPGANCGACGEPGCAGYAAKIVNNNISISLCPVGGSELAEEISKIMGIEADKIEPQVARVRCQGGDNVTKNKFVYQGPLNCAAAQQIEEGYKVCSFGCLGLGDCVRSCPFDAIHLNENSIPIVDNNKCTGCGNCVVECPRDIIILSNIKCEVFVKCLNQEKGALMRKGCSVGCIACQLCVKACKQVFENNPDIESAISIENFLAEVDCSKCINCGKCSEVCPPKQRVITYPSNKTAKV